MLGREASEVRSTARFLLSPDVMDRLPEQARPPYLRGVPLAPDYPWLENLQESHRGMVPPWPKGEAALDVYVDAQDGGEVAVFLALPVSLVPAQGRGIVPSVVEGSLRRPGEIEVA